MPFVSISKFADVRTDVSLDSMEHYTAGKVPAHERVYYEPKVIRVRDKLYLAQFRFCPESNKFRWHTFGHPVVKPRTGTQWSNRQFLDLSDTNARLNAYYNDGTTDGTTRRTPFEDVLSFLRYYGVTKTGKIFVALPEVPIMCFGRDGHPFPPIKGKS